MTHLSKNLTFYLSVTALMFVQITTAQNSQSKIIVPTDPVVEYNPQSPPTMPDWEHQIVKWVRTYNIANGAVQYKYNNVGWNSDIYKAYAFGQGFNTAFAFRLLFPRTYSVQDDGKKYPLIIFLHGLGENDTTYLPPTPNYDNHWHLLQGPHEFDIANQNGMYDGFVLAPQLQNPNKTDLTSYYWSVRNDIRKIVKYLIDSNKVDPFRIIVNGLSAGGTGSWDMLIDSPTSISSAIPMSAPVDFYHDSATISKIKFTSIWTSQGLKDIKPYPYQTQMVADSMKKYGANFKLNIYPESQHNTWDNVWNEWRFWPFVNQSYSSNPWPLYGRSKFWTGEPINTTIGINQGYEAYRWRRNGLLLPGTSNEIQATSTGIYDAQVMKDGIWSEWSYVPVNVASGNSFRKEAEDWYEMRGVQTEVTFDAGGGRNVGWIEQGDWIDYTLGDTVLPAPNVQGTYILKLRVAALDNGAQLQIKNQDSVVLATVNIEQTNAWQNWTTQTVTIQLLPGRQNIRIQSTSTTGFNINWIELSKAEVQSPLPVKFVYFNAWCQNSLVNLQWKTAQEQNSSGFSVQRSTDGMNWTEIGSVVAAGQSAQERSYVFVDRGSLGSVNFYRVVEKDYSGQQTISSVVKSSCSARNEISLYPNPSSGSSVLSVVLDRAANVTVQILDSKGALMQQKQVLLPQGSSTVALDVSSYAKGIYTVKVTYNSEVKTIKMVRK